MNNYNKQFTNKANPTFQFLWLFNDIDKYFDTLIDNSNFVPYNEKIRIIKDSEHPISHYIRQHQYLLKFFWEVRNHISHGIKIDGQTFTTPSKHAISRISQCRDIIVSPPTAQDFFYKEVQTVNNMDSLSHILKHSLTSTHVPVYSAWKISGFINEKLIARRSIMQVLNWEIIDIDKLDISDLDIQSQIEHYKFIHPETNIHSILHQFIDAKNNKKILNAIIISDTLDIDWSIKWITLSIHSY